MDGFRNKNIYTITQIIEILKQVVIPFLEIASVNCWNYGTGLLRHVPALMDLRTHLVVPTLTPVPINIRLPRTKKFGIPIRIRIQTPPSRRPTYPPTRQPIVGSTVRDYNNNTSKRL